MIVVIMGAAGSGKTTVGRRLAATLGWPFHDADDFHSAASVAKMRAGAPLDEADRAPWLARLRRRIDELVAAGASAVLACSALRQRHRALLLGGCPESCLVYLAADRALLARRLHERADHFFPAALLDSQLATLEAPERALVFDAGRPSEEIVAGVVAALRAARAQPG